MIQRMLTGGLIAGFAAGLLAAFLHFAFIQDLILLGEGYETGTLMHDAAGAAHGHDAAAEAGTSDGATTDLRRNALTVLFTALVYSAYGLLMVAGFALAERFGHRIGLREGLLWGIAGFAAFQMAPALGLAPELPGAVAAPLESRQAWFAATIAATAAGLALIGYGRGLAAYALAAVLLAAPHVIGAPHPETFGGAAPSGLAADYAARVLGVGLIVWAALGALAGRLWSAGPA